MAGSLIVRAKLNGSAGKQAINIYILLRLSPLWVDLHFLLRYSEARSCCEHRERETEKCHSVPFASPKPISRSPIHNWEAVGGETQAFPHEAETRNCLQENAPYWKTWRRRRFSFTIALPVVVRFIMSRKWLPGAWWMGAAATREVRLLPECTESRVALCGALDPHSFPRSDAACPPTNPSHLPG